MMCYVKFPEAWFKWLDILHASLVILQCIALRAHGRRMKSKCKCSLSFLDNKKLCHGFFPPTSYCIIIIINKKERTTEVLLRRCFFLSVQSRHPAFPLCKDSFEMWVSRGPVPGARVAANPRLLSCKYHTHRNVGGKEDLEGPLQVWLPVRPFWALHRRPGGTVLYIIKSRVSREEYTTYSASVTSEDKFDSMLDLTFANTNCKCRV